MKEVITLAIFALIFAALAFLCRNAGNRNQDMKYANGIIERISHVDGEINYYVTFKENGKMLTGKSITYPPSTKRLSVGDAVEINYYETKARWPRVIILDEDLKPCENSRKFLPKVFKWISPGFFVVAVLFLVKECFARLTISVSD